MHVPLITPRKVGSTKRHPPPHLNLVHLRWIDGSHDLWRLVGREEGYRLSRINAGSRRHWDGHHLADDRRAQLTVVQGHLGIDHIQFRLVDSFFGLQQRHTRSR